MSAIFGETIRLGQANGPEVELVVSGDEWYATYETPSGHPVVYDESLGLFCYARVVDGRFESTRVPVSEPPPPDSEPHAREADAVRREKVLEKQAMRALQGEPESGDPEPPEQEIKKGENP